MKRNENDGAVFRGKRPTNNGRLTLRLSPEATTELYRLAALQQTTRTAIIEAAILAHSSGTSTAPPTKKTPAAKLAAIRAILDN